MYEWMNKWMNKWMNEYTNPTIYKKKIDDQKLCSLSDNEYGGNDQF